MEGKTHAAICIIQPDKGKVSGTVKFTQTEGQKIKISAEIHGLTPGKHGFHVH